MKKLSLKNLKQQQLSNTLQRQINGGSATCSSYYCANVNPNANCCQCGGGTSCSAYYCANVNPNASCCQLH